LKMREATLGGADMMQGAHRGSFNDYFPPGFCPGVSTPIVCFYFYSINYEFIAL